MTNNIILKTDSYKPTQWPMYPEGTEAIHSYFEARKGGKFEKTVFFGLQDILLSHFEGRVLKDWMIDQAEEVLANHIGPGVFNKAGWKHILDDCGGRLPIKIWAVPEGTPKDAGDVLMVVENYGGEKTAWLTNYIETLLVQTWYPSTVASLGYAVKKMMAQYLTDTTGSTDGIDFMLHDFGCRGATGMEAAAIGGMAHLVNFKGTDTMPALIRAYGSYGASLSTLGFSVAAAEHSVMTSLGRDGESEMVGRILAAYPTGIVAAPIDSYDYVNYVTNIAGKDHYDTIMSREGKFVFRPDSCSPQHPTPREEMVWLAYALYDTFGGTENDLGYKVIDPHVGMLWGDGIEPEGIEHILWSLKNAGFAASNVVFGMGGGLLQKVNRDTQRFAFKCSAQLRDGTWYDVAKQPLDVSKTSKAGRFDEAKCKDMGLELVYDTGYIQQECTFDEVRANTEADQ